ncbi:NADP-dependent oxidoreductase [Haloplanus rubicundus]|jgi:NADPH:quinone reductase-like Zn-dependent oxidoreductase|uniref:NADP-dependent oxidoreductase n=1 Tax=Haloplanus rubicundus TaxID=1547898 RepID=A0A345EIJ7_9EURY|nr:NADP-dependent oxidoreductase [Haloplanus rubicundus]AXG12019.1 NADP-dependent oxidoreductase [Haloplanus rubicundus]
MKTIQLTETDGTDALTYESVPRPKPDNDELLVRVHAAGVNPLDWLICRGILPELRDEPLPWIPGWELSGVVESVGADVTEFEPEDAVCGMVRLPGAGGTFAEFTTMTVDEVTAKPPSLSHTEAAGLPMAGQTAFHALYQASELDTGQRVLVHAAAGGVGHMAVQFATNTGAHVIGTASGRNEQFLRRLGIDEFVNYREGRFEDVIDDVDIVLDSIGGEVLERSVEVAQSGGVIVTLPDQPAADTIERFQAEHDVKVWFFDVLTESDPATLQSVTDRVERGVLKPTISGSYPLSKAQEALDKSAEGHVRGKLVLDLTAE